MSAWMIRAGHGGVYAEDWLDKGKIGIGWDFGSKDIASMKREQIRVVPEKLRTLDHGRPWSDDQFASTRLSSNRDMSR